MLFDNSIRGVIHVCDRPVRPQALRLDGECMAGDYFDQHGDVGDDQRDDDLGGSHIGPKLIKSHEIECCKDFH